MRIVCMDLHTRQQSPVMLDIETGELVEKIVEHESDAPRGRAGYRIGHGSALNVTIRNSDKLPANITQRNEPHQQILVI